MQLKSKNKTDAKKIKDGVWMPTKDDENIKFLLTYFNSTKATMFFEMALQRLKASGEYSDADAVLLATNETLVEVVILGWVGLEEDGVVVEYSKEEAIRILGEYEEVGIELMSMSLQIDLFRKEELAKTEKK